MKKFRILQESLPPKLNEELLFLEICAALNLDKKLVLFQRIQEQNEAGEKTSDTIEISIPDNALSIDLLSIVSSHAPMMSSAESARASNINILDLQLSESKIIADLVRRIKELESGR